MTKLLLLSGGLDSTAIAAWLQPDAAVTIDYGHKPARGEITASTAITEALGLPHSVITVDASATGSGLLAGSPPASISPASEWWPFRNQLLITLAAAYAIGQGFDEILVGSVASDGTRHADGTGAFYATIDQLVSMQEGSIRVSAPGLQMQAVELLRKSGVSREVLGWTHSCHRSELACGECPGCWKRAAVLNMLEDP